MAEINRLLAIMRRLRDPETGCPWDREQTFHTIAPYTIEEAYEVADAIEREALDELKGELGDLLFQVVFHAQMAEEQTLFDFNAVAATIADKLERRHPHVFGDEQIESAQAQTQAWEQHKEAERAEAQRNKQANEPTSQSNLSILDGVAVTLPGLTRAVKLTKRASRVGFDWPDILSVFDKIEEEIEEVRSEVIAKADRQRLEEEIGDLFFAVCNLARHAQVDPETAMRRANAKFERRFHWIEQQLAIQGKTAQDTPLDELDYLWEQSKEALAKSTTTL